jgi:hypothetical protein
MLIDFSVGARNNPRTYFGSNSDENIVCKWHWVHCTGYLKVRNVKRFFDAFFK